MKKYPAGFLLLILYLLVLSGCTSYRLRVANDYYEQNAFVDAIPEYQKVLSKKKNPTAMIRIADCYRQTNQLVEAEQWYKKVMNIRQQRPVDKLYYAQVLMMNGKYTEAKQWLEIYSHYTRGDYRLQKLMESCDSIPKFFTDTARYRLELLKLNAPGTSNFGPAFYRSGIVFSSDRKNEMDKNLRNPANGKSYTDLYYAKKTERGNWLDPELIRGEVNGVYNDGPAFFNRDGNTMYLTRNNYQGATADIEKNKKNFNVLKVFKCVPDGNGWKISGEMPFCSEDYSVGHTVINSTGDAMYFSSDMPWGYGGTDLYVVKWVNGRWNNPQNLGASINSPGNEMFPFIQNDTVLYFSSDGNYGLGGLDIFQSFYDGTAWSDPRNLGYPVNSSFDDTGFIIDSLDRSGFFCSNRNGGVDRIYSFAKAPPFLSVSGEVTDAVLGTTLQEARLVLKTKGLADTTLVTSQSGKYSFPLSTGRNYTLIASYKGFYASKVSLSTIGKRESEGIIFKFSLNPIVLNKPEIWRGFGFNKKDWELLPETKLALDSLVGVMADNPSLQIELASYTDSRGNDQENIALTQKRAESCADYLSAKGISQSRIKTRAGGETKLLNNCGNGILCLDEEHAENNRIEIRVTGGK